MTSKEILSDFRLCNLNNDLARDGVESQFLKAVQQLSVCETNMMIKGLFKCREQPFIIMIHEGRVFSFTPNSQRREVLGYKILLALGSEILYTKSSQNPCILYCILLFEIGQ